MLWKNGYRVSSRTTSPWWNGMVSLNRQMDHWLGGTLGPVSREYPLIEVWSGEEGLVLVAQMPGVDRDTLDITVDGRTLSISGNRPAVDLPEGARRYRQERDEGSFSRNLSLPYEVDIEAATAAYADGTLRIKMPRVPEEKSRKIAVNGM